MNTDQPITRFGELLRDWRERSGLSQQAIADLSDEIVPDLLQRYEDHNLKTLSRELVLQYEAPTLRAQPRENTIIVLAHTYAEALRRAGYDSNPVVLYDSLRLALRPAIPIQAVSFEALQVEILMSYYPEEERLARYEGIIEGLKAEQKKRASLQKGQV